MKTRTLSELRNEATRAAEYYRGHQLGEWIIGRYQASAHAKCKLCGRTVTINTHPAPNQIDIAGEAVALDCPGIPGDVAREVESKTVELYHDRGQLSDDQINDLLHGERTLGEIWVDDLWQYYDHYIWKLEKQVIEQTLKDHDLDHVSVLDFLEQYPDSRPIIDENLGRLLRNSHAYVGLELDKHYPDPYGGLHYQDIKPITDLLNIDPKSLLDYLPIENAESIPERQGHEIVEPSDLAEAFVNMGYAGTWVVMLGGYNVADIVKHRDAIRERGLVLEPGTRLIIHNFAVGASSTPVQLQDELRIEPESIETLYNDKALKYGIQATCGFVGRAWEGRWHLPEQEA